MTIEEYIQLLKDHDWYHIMSDDHSVYERGKIAHNNLLRIAGENPGFDKEFFKMKNEKYKNIK